MIYAENMELSFKRILSFLNLDINTTVFGSLDRYHWGWKKKDFQDATLSYAIIPLIKAMRKLSYSHEIQEYALKPVVQNLLKIQHPNGSFDQVYPYEKHPKVALDITEVFYLYLTRFDENSESVRIAYKKALQYSLHSEETYGTISNHLAHHAFEYLRAYKFFADIQYYEKAMDNIDIISSNTSAEGCHTEYLGADPGYQTRTLRYLIKCLDMLKEDDKVRVLDICNKSASFLERCILPDGTLYAAFGSRNTEIIYPSGIEAIAMINPSFKPLARRVRKGFEGGLNIMPLQMEFDNFLRLYDDFLDVPLSVDDGSDATNYHHENEHKEFFLETFGLQKINIGQYSVYIHLKYGGSLCVYHKDKALYFDGGFLLESSSGTFYGTKNLKQNSTFRKRNRDIEVTSTFFMSSHKEVSPIKQLILRVLNFTFLRIEFFSNIFRSIMVRIMIKGSLKRKVPKLKRAVTIADNILIISDFIESDIEMSKLYRVYTPHLFHMVSSRYNNRSLNINTVKPICEKSGSFFEVSIEKYIKMDSEQ